MAVTLSMQYQDKRYSVPGEHDCSHASVWGENWSVSVDPDRRASLRLIVDEPNDDGIPSASLTLNRTNDYNYTEWICDRYREIARLQGSVVWPDVSEIREALEWCEAELKKVS